MASLAQCSTFTESTSDAGAETGAPPSPNGTALANCDPTIPNGKRVFIADSFAVGGGIEAGDKACMDSASAAGICGSYVAWLSTSTVNAVDRLPRGVQYVVVKDGVVSKVAPSRDALGQGLITSINRNASGGVSPHAEVWTGTLATGGRADQRCSDWKDKSGGAVGVTGTVTQTSSKWTDSGQPVCSKVYSVACFEL